MYALVACEGLHGHVKVSPADGTVAELNVAEFDIVKADTVFGIVSDD